MKIAKSFCTGGILLWAIGLGGVSWAGEAGPVASPAKALSFPFSYTGEGLANLSGGTQQRAIYEGLLSIGVGGDLEKLIHWKGGSFLVSAIYPHGPSLTNNFVRDLNVVSNIDAFDSIRLYEAWFQQDLADGKFSIRLGQILVDSDFFISNSAAIFVNSAFGVLPMASNNLKFPSFPVAGPGGRFHWKYSESLSVQSGIYTGDAGDESTNNQHGVSWRLGGGRGMLAISEIAYTSNALDDKSRLGGVYKLGAFYQSPTSRYAFPTLHSHADASGYFMADQQLWRKPGEHGNDQALSGFFRIGATPANRNLVPFYFDTGLNFKGLVPGRKDDGAGVGFSYTRLSGSAGVPIESHHEAILEATYTAQVQTYLLVQPDFQYVFNPGGIQNSPNALIAGLRCTLSF